MRSSVTVSHVGVASVTRTRSLSSFADLLRFAAVATAGFGDGLSRKRPPPCPLDCDLNLALLCRDRLLLSFEVAGDGAGGDGDAVELLTPKKLRIDGCSIDEFGRTNIHTQSESGSERERGTVVQVLKQYGTWAFIWVSVRRMGADSGVAAEQRPS